MDSFPVKEEIIRQLEYLNDDQLRQILGATMSVQGKLPPAIPGDVLIADARRINFPKEDLAEIARAIEEDCERIDWDGWK